MNDSKRQYDHILPIFEVLQWIPIALKNHVKNPECVFMAFIE